eukprot:Hpha_TRINITY_DN13600_c0_g1::TRINITY_DN13600_c0_g1_i2::g.122491::m.122491
MADLIVDELTEVLAEPYVYLSTSQVDRVTRYPVLAPLAPRLPGWVPQRLIAQALGHSSAGMRNAVAEVGRPYVWATEFENVHGVWAYREPRLNIDGEEYDSPMQCAHKEEGLSTKHEPVCCLTYSGAEGTVRDESPLVPFAQYLL